MIVQHYEQEKSWYTPSRRSPDLHGLQHLELQSNKGTRCELSMKKEGVDSLPMTKRAHIHMANPYPCEHTTLPFWIMDTSTESRPHEQSQWRTIPFLRTPVSTLTRLRSRTWLLLRDKGEWRAATTFVLWRRRHVQLSNTTPTTHTSLTHPTIGGRKFQQNFHHLCKHVRMATLVYTIHTPEP